MTPSMSFSGHHHVVIAGGGIAGVEAALALRALAGRTSQLTLLTPGAELLYRPLTVVEPFASRATRRYRLSDICDDLGVQLHRGALARVEGDAHALVTEAGERIGYDALVIATGARARVALPHAHSFLADADPESLHWIVRELEAGTVRRVAFVAPHGPSWYLPLYELALMSAVRVHDMGIEDARLTIVTPEDAPLTIFHGAGSDAVARLLDDARVAVITETYAHDYDGRALVLTPGDRTLDVERVVALPVLSGPALAGVPSDRDGFVHVDEYGRVPGLDGVYAAGDATTFAIKQGGVAAQQADVIAALIARRAGVAVAEPDARPRLRAVLFTGDAPLYLRATITGGEGAVSIASRHCPWWPPHKVAARYLAPFLADRDDTIAVAPQAALATPLTAEE